MYTLGEAKEYILSDILRHSPSAEPKDRPKIMDEKTLERSFGWVFIYNNEAYLDTGQSHMSWGGPGPIIFNKFTGEVRLFSATFDLRQVAEDYEKELEAGEGSWVLFVESADSKEIAMKLKSILNLSGPEALKHAKRIPGGIFKGNWRTLTEFAPQIPGAVVQVSSSKEPELPELQPYERGTWILV